MVGGDGRRRPRGASQAISKDCPTLPLRVEAREIADASKCRGVIPRTQLVDRAGTVLSQRTMRADDGAEVKVGGAERGDRWGEHAPQILVGSRRGEINELECRFKLGLCQVTTYAPIRWDNCR